MKMLFNRESGKKLLSFLLAAAMLLPLVPASLIPSFAEDEVYTVGDLSSLEQALSKAEATDRVVINGDITIPEGKTLSVPKGVRLIIAYNEEGEYGGHGADDYGSKSLYSQDFLSDKPVYTLTVSKGAVLEVYGSLYVGGKLVAVSGTRYQGATGSLYSKLICNGTVNFNEGELYCYGYIEGEGQVNTKGASQVYSPFVIGNWNGGGYVYGLYKVGKVSPLTEYVMPNIKTELSVCYGSTVYGLCALYSGGGVNVSTPKLVGSNQALIILEDSGSRVVSKYNDKKYDTPLSGKLELDFYGNVKLGSLYMEVYYTPISTAEVVFPLPYCFDVTVKKGGLLSTVNKYAVLPGASLTVEEGGAIILEGGAALYLLEGMADTDSVPYPYSSSTELVESGYSPSSLLVLSGKLTVLDGATLAGTISKVQNGGVIELAEGALLTGKYVSGINQSYNVNFTDYAYYNKTEYPLTAMALDYNSKLFKLEAGRVYYSANPNASFAAGEFDYVYYGSEAGHKAENKKGGADRVIEGSLNVFEVIYNYTDGRVESVKDTSLKAPTTGYGWYDLYTGEAVTSISGDRFYMLYESNRFVTYKYGDEEITLVIGKDGVLPTPDFKKTHYLLDGWSKSEGGEKAYEINGVADFDSATLYPVWKAVKYTFTYLLTPENYEHYKGSYLYIDKNGNYVIAVEEVEYNTSANPPSKDVMDRELLNFSWSSEILNVDRDREIFGQYFEYGIRNMRTGVVHTDLASAIAAAQNGDVLRVQQSCQASVTVPSGLEITIDLNGFEIYASTGSVITNSGKLTLTDSREGGAVYQMGKGASSSNVYYAVTNEKTGELIIEGGAIKSDSDGSYTRTLHNKGNITFISGTISSNAGYTVYNVGGTVVQKGGEISYGGTSTSSYGVYNYNKSAYILEGGSVNAVNGGRAFYNWLNSTLEMRGGSIYSTSGGALYNNGATATIYGGSITTDGLATLTYALSNTRYSTTQAVLNIYGGEISAPKGCRGLLNQKSTVNMYGGEINALGNMTYGYAVNNDKASVFNLYGGKIYSKSSYAIFTTGSKADCPTVNTYGGHVVSAGGASYCAIMNANGATYGVVNIYGGSFASNGAYAVNTGTNGSVNLFDSAFGGLYKYTTAPINKVTSSSTPIMVGIECEGEYEGYSCMTLETKGYEAAIGNKKYQYISQALAEGKEGDTVTLLADAVLNSSAYPKATVDLMGYDLDIGANTLTASTLRIKNSGNIASVKSYENGNFTSAITSGQIVLEKIEKEGDVFVGYSHVEGGEIIKEPKNGGTLTICPVFASQLKFTVVFKNEDGSIISQNEYSYGQQIVEPEEPVKESDNTFTYRFIGWNEAVEDICYQSKEYTAMFASTYIVYTVIFNDCNGQPWVVGEYHYGDEIEIPAGPEKESDKTFRYTFEGWDNEPSKICLSDAVYNPTYSSSYIEYTITFFDKDGNIIKTESCHYGDIVKCPNQSSVVVDENSYLSFDGWNDGQGVWDVQSVTVEGNCEYRAVYSLKGYQVNYNEKVSLSSATILFQSSLTINFRAKASDLAVLDGYDMVYVVFERHYADGEVETTTCFDYTVNGSYLVFPYKNIAAKEMGDRIEATLYAIKGENKYYGKTVDYGILKYCTNMLSKNTTDIKMKTAIVDMLNYGSAAQIYFNYNTENLVNSVLTEEQKSYASWDGVSHLDLSTVKSYTPLEGETAKIKGISLLYSSSVMAKYQINLASYTADKTKLSLVISYVNSVGDECERVVPFSQFVQNGSVYTVEFDGIAVKDMGVAFEAAVYSCYGEENESQVTGVATYSIESYAYSKADGSDKKLSDLVKNLMVFSRSVKSYLVG